MHPAGLAVLLFQDQAPLPPAAAVVDDGRVWLWIALAVGVLALVAAWMMARKVIAADTDRKSVV